MSSGSAPVSAEMVFVKTPEDSSASSAVMPLKLSSPTTRAVASAVGAGVGWKDGVAVGSPGFTVGRGVGVTEGAAVGCGTGDRVGLSVGCTLGVADGAGDG
jgi:hypothetical protein